MGIPVILGDQDTLEGVIGKFREEMSRLINDAGGEARLVLMEAYQLAQALIDTLASVYDDALAKTFRELDNQQKKAFQDANKLLGKLQDSLREPTDAALEVSEEFTTTLNEIAVWAKAPIVLRYEPKFVAPAALDEPIRINIIGFKFRQDGVNELPILHIGGWSGRALEFLNNNLSFTISRDVMPVSDHQTAFVPATLVITYQKGFGPFKRKHFYHFKLLFTVLPETLGSYSVEQTLRHTETDRQTWTSPEVVAGRTTTYQDERVECYEPPDGWSFDPNTAVITRRLLEAWWVNGGPDLRFNGGKVEWARERTERRICLLALAYPTERDTSARTVGRFQVDIVRERVVERQQVSDPRPLGWSDVSIEIDDQAVRSVITVTFFDDIKRTFSATDLGRAEFLDVVPDTRNGIVILRPIQMWSV